MLKNEIAKLFTDLETLSNDYETRSGDINTRLNTLFSSIGTLYGYEFVKKSQRICMQSDIGFCVIQQNDTDNMADNTCIFCEKHYN